ncbi:MAG: hypothetical protein DRI73_09720 [Bacteroidetes bacterium]|nr:MAG: hypothetical protein DRI73_09720 [Bacteroidota bacterium]
MRAIVFFISFIMFPLWAFSLCIDQTYDGVEYRVAGTGNTTGHVVDLHIYNSSTDEVKMELGPYLIPSADTTQGYVVQDKYEVVVPAGAKIKLELIGYCTNAFLPPVRLGGILKPFSKWAGVELSPDIYPGVKIDTLDGFTRFIPLSSDSILFCYPGTVLPLLYRIDIDMFPLTSAKMVINLVHRIEATYDLLKKQGRIQTPFSDNISKEAWSIRQQTIWYALSILKGSNYGKEALRNSLIGQYEDLTGKNYETFSDKIKLQLEKGINEFWEAILDVGFEAKVIVRKI